MTQPLMLVVLAWLLKLGLAGLLVYAGMTKLLDPAGFASAIGGFRLVPDGMIPTLAVTVPFLEVVVGLGLMVSVVERGALFLTIGMLGAFAVALFSAWWRGLNVDCGCFGGGGSGTNELWVGVARNMVLMAVAGWLGYRRLAGRLNSW